MKNATEPFNCLYSLAEATYRGNVGLLEVVGTYEGEQQADHAFLLFDSVTSCLTTPSLIGLIVDFSALQSDGDGLLLVTLARLEQAVLPCGVVVSPTQLVPVTSRLLYTNVAEAAAAVIGEE